MIGISGLRLFSLSGMVGLSASRKKPSCRAKGGFCLSWVPFGLPLSTALPKTLEQHRVGIRMAKVLEEKLKFPSQ